MQNFVDIPEVVWKIERDLSYEISLYTNRKINKASDNAKSPPQMSITQRLWTD